MRRRGEKRRGRTGWRRGRGRTSGEGDSQVERDTEVHGEIVVADGVRIRGIALEGNFRRVGKVLRAGVGGETFAPPVFRGKIQGGAFLFEHVQRAAGSDRAKVVSPGVVKESEVEAAVDVGDVEVTRDFGGADERLPETRALRCAAKMWI